MAAPLPLHHLEVYLEVVVSAHVSRGSKYLTHDASSSFARFIQLPPPPHLSLEVLHLIHGYLALQHLLQVGLVLQPPLRLVVRFGCWLVCYIFISVTNICIKHHVNVSSASPLRIWRTRCWWIRPIANSDRVSGGPVSSHQKAGWDERNRFAIYNGHASV